MPCLTCDPTVTAYERLSPLLPPVGLRHCRGDGGVDFSTALTPAQLRVGTTFRGNLAPLHRAIRRARRGEPLTIWVIGGSISWAARR